MNAVVLTFSLRRRTEQAPHHGTCDRAARTRRRDRSRLTSPTASTTSPRRWRRQRCPEAQGALKPKVAVALSWQCSGRRVPQRRGCPDGVTDAVVTIQDSSGAAQAEFLENGWSVPGDVGRPHRSDPRADLGWLRRRLGDQALHRCPEEKLPEPSGSSRIGNLPVTRRTTRLARGHGVVDDPVRAVTQRRDINSPQMCRGRTGGEAALAVVIPSGAGNATPGTMGRTKARTTTRSSLWVWAMRPWCRIGRDEAPWDI